MKVITLPETNGSPLKMDGWKSFLWGWHIFRAYVSFRECILPHFMTFMETNHQRLCGSAWIWTSQYNEWNLLPDNPPPTKTRLTRHHAIWNASFPGVGNGSLCVPSLARCRGGFKRIPPMMTSPEFLRSVGSRRAQGYKWSYGAPVSKVVTPVAHFKDIYNNLFPIPPCRVGGMGLVWTSWVKSPWEKPHTSENYYPLRTNISTQKGTFEDDSPFPKVEYVTSLEGVFLIGIWWIGALSPQITKKTQLRFWVKLDYLAALVQGTCFPWNLNE